LFIIFPANPSRLSNYKTNSYNPHKIKHTVIILIF
jgi:hypothetical protein